jgi:pimeloyl-ACP methyl ester carboxylesterase
MELEERTLPLPSGRTQVLYEAGSGPTLLWLHGLGGVEAADPLLQALARDHRVVAPLAPGFSDLEELEGLESFHDLALHYDDLLGALGLESVPLVGQYFGAMAAAEVAAHFPRRASRLVLISPLGLWRDDLPVTDLFAVPYTELPQLLFADPSRARAETAGVAAGAEDVEELVRLAQGMTTVAKFVWPIPDKGLRGRLYRIAAPTLVLWGAADAIVPAAYADQFAEAIRDARRVVVPGGGHLVAWDRPDETVAAVREFL